jgi:hypothetical protein
MITLPLAFSVRIVRTFCHSLTEPTELAFLSMLLKIAPIFLRMMPSWFVFILIAGTEEMFRELKQMTEASVLQAR